MEFQKQSPKILDVIQKRAENIVKEIKYGVKRICSRIN